MYAQKGMTTPAHAHKKKKEDIICRWGKLAVKVWAGEPAKSADKTLAIPVNHEEQEVSSRRDRRTGSGIASDTGSRYLSRVLSCFRRMHHWRGIDGNDDLHDNFFVNPSVGRYPGIEEDEAPVLSA